MTEFNRELAQARLVPAVVEALRAIRHYRGFSQNELAKRSGVAQRTVCFMESGGRAPSTETLLKLGHGLDAVIVLPPDGRVQVIPREAFADQVLLWR